MASRKGRSTALQRIFAHSAHHMCGLIRKNALRLVYRPFRLAIP